MTSRKLEEVWSERVRQWRSSGLGLEAYQRHANPGYSAASLRAWLQRLDRGGGVRLVAVQPEAPSVVPTPAETPALVSIQFGAVSLQVPVGAAPERVGRLVASLTRSVSR